jgi:error-prone DNA polymerase
MPISTPRYAELHCRSAFHFLCGASLPDVLVQRASELGLQGLAVTDADGLYGAVRLHLAAEGTGVQPIYGSELSLEDGSRVVVLAQDRSGYRRISALITAARQELEKGGARTSLDELCAQPRGIVLLSGGFVGPIDRTLLGVDAHGPHTVPRRAWTGERDPEALALRRARLTEAGSRYDDETARLRHARELAARFQEAFGERFFLEVHRHHLPEEDWLQPRIRQLASDLGVERVATNLVHYARPEDRPLADVLACLRNRCTLDKAGTRLLPNGHFRLKSPRQMQALFRGESELLERSVSIADSCRFRLPELPYGFPEFPIPGGQRPIDYLRRLVADGAARRYGPSWRDRPEVVSQLKHEVEVIERMGLAGYFLVMWDIVRFCERESILAQGRGSAANSAVCFCLGITAVDPIGLDLLFERFLSEESEGYPDIDLDVANGERERVIQYVYGRYGRRHAAMVCNVIAYRSRLALRETAKVFGLSPDQTDELIRALRHHRDRERPIDLDNEGLEGLSLESPRVRQVLELAGRLVGHPRHIGIHPGGMVVSSWPLGEACPVENATMPDRSVLQWDKDDVDHMRMVKIDLLGLGMLQVLQEAREELGKRGIDFDMARLSYAEPAVYDLICAADTVGLFQIESRAQINTLPRMQPRCFHDLVVEVSIIRPGPIQGGMVHPYLKRRNGEEEVTYPHPSLEPVLRRTLGVPLFQEQAMKVAVVAAGFTPNEAERLRKVMGFKRPGTEMVQLLERMRRGMSENGFADEVIDSVLGMIHGFSSYGFPESHAASFALIVYASAHLKCHHPAEFYAALLNCQPMGFYSPAVLVSDARRHGVQVQPIDVCHSHWDWTVDGLFLRGGLRQVRGLPESLGTDLVRERERAPFADLRDFATRVPLPRIHAEKLARAGAFASFGLSPRRALWELAALPSKRLPLEAPPPETEAPAFRAFTPLEADGHALANVGYVARRHPLLHLRPYLDRLGALRSDLLQRRADRAVVHTAGLVITRQRPGTAKGTVFLTLEDEAGLSNVIVHAAIYERHRRMLHQARLLELRGTLQNQHGVVQILATWFRDLAEAPDLPDDMREVLGSARSRDFH